MLQQYANYCSTAVLLGNQRTAPRNNLIRVTLRCRQSRLTCRMMNTGSSNLCSWRMNLVSRRRPKIVHNAYSTQSIQQQQHVVSPLNNNRRHNCIRNQQQSTTATFPEYSCPSFIIETATATTTTMQSSILKQQQQQHQQTAIPATATPIRIAGASTPITSKSLPLLAQQQQQQQQQQGVHTVVETQNTQVAATTAVLNSNSSTNTDKIKISDLRALFIASSIPMIGFGFMDQFVLIQAGGYIDATFGISFGLATLSAAAAGQVVSDVSGVVFGGALERFLSTNTSWLRTPNITQLQRQLPICRNVAMLGAIIGVIIGCAIGATSLLFVDLEARNRMERAQRLREIVQDMITTAAAPTVAGLATEMSTPEILPEQDHVFRCDSCTVYVVSTTHLTLPTDHDSDRWKVNLKDVSSSITTTKDKNKKNDSHDDADEIKTVQRCISSQSIVLSDDRRTMYAPLIKKGVKHHDNNGTGSSVSNEIMAVVAFRYDSVHDTDKRTSNASNDGTSRTISGCYSDEDVIAARVMARHIAIFMDR